MYCVSFIWVLCICVDHVCVCCRLSKRAGGFPPEDWWTPSLPLCGGVPPSTVHLLAPCVTATWGPRTPSRRPLREAPLKWKLLSSLKQVPQVSTPYFGVKDKLELENLTRDGLAWAGPRVQPAPLQAPMPPSTMGPLGAAQLRRGWRGNVVCFSSPRTGCGRVNHPGGKSAGPQRICWFL